MNLGNSKPVVVITGASSGIGLVAATALAEQGWRVIALGRDASRSQVALARIQAAATSHGAIDMIQADLSVMAEVERASTNILALTDRVDVLINNAGGTSAALAITPEGNEAVFASNHLAPFLLTARLLPALKIAAAANAPGHTRVINVSSAGHEVSGGLDWDDIQSIGNFVPTLAYCNVKLANILFTRELARRLETSGIVSHAVHPGAVATNFYSYGDVGMQEFGRTTPLISPEAGADTMIWLATDDEPGTASGGYYAERAQIAPSAAALDDAAASKLWQESERLIAKSLGESAFRFA